MLLLECLEVRKDIFRAEQAGTAGQEAVAQSLKAYTFEQRVPGSNPATAWLDFVHRQLCLYSSCSWLKSMSCLLCGSVREVIPVLIGRARNSTEILKWNELLDLSLIHI